MSYPEHEKLDKVHEKSQAIGEFIEWLSNEKAIDLRTYDEENDVYLPVYESKEKLLADYFDINLKELEKEKRAMLDKIRRADATI